MQFARHAPPLVLLRPKNLATCTTPLALQTNEFGHVMDADENVPRSMNCQRDYHDVEIVTVEGSASFI